MCFFNLFRKKKPKPIPQTGTGDDMLIVNNLNGFGAGGEEPISALSYRTYTANMASETITIPSSSAVGDFAVLFDLGEGGPPSLVTPSGWTNAMDYSSGGFRLAVHYKVLVSGDPNLSITGMVGSIRTTKMMLVFDATGNIASVSTPTFSREITAGNPSSQTISASGQSPIVLAMAGTYAATPAFTTASPSFDGSQSIPADSSWGVVMGYKIYGVGSSPASHTVDVADTGNSNGLWSGYFKIA